MRWGLLALFVAGCGGPPELTVCVRTAPDDHPFSFDPPPTSMRLRAIPLSGPEVIRSVDAAADEVRLPPLDLGPWVFVLEVLRDEALLATGRTPLVEVTRDMNRTPCLYLASVGTFGGAADPDPSAGRFAVPEPGSATALVLTDTGLQRYDHETGAFGSERLAATTGSGTVWVRLPDSRAAAIGDAGAHVLEEGRVEPVRSAATGLDGAAGIAAGVDSVLLVGGASGPDATPQPEASVRVLDLATGTTEVLPGAFPVRDARLAALGNGRFVAVGGNSGTDAAPVPSDLLAVVDPVDGVLAESSLDVPRMGHAIAVVEGNILVFGGRGADGGLLSAIERFRLASGQPVHAAQPQSMTAPRAGLVAIVVGEDVLLAGGEAADAEVAAASEIFRFALNGTEPADPPGAALPDPAAVTLHDGSVLVVGGGSAVVYRP
ncbi:MAG: hypothetical protein HYY06_14490 [Deltaproteobacteria bacterium]|nr:hypothetical protein [Deltaproteobacteria bacterium]